MELSEKDIIDIIQKYSLTVRCLPCVVETYWTYKEGDENIKYVDPNGKPSKSIKSVVIQDFDLEHFQKTPPPKWETGSPEKRFANWKKNFPNGRKLLKDTRQVENGGWWCVKETKNINSTIVFDRKNDFIAPTLKEAIQLYLNSL